MFDYMIRLTWSAWCMDLVNTRSSASTSLVTTLSSDKYNYDSTIKKKSASKHEFPINEKIIIQS